MSDTDSSIVAILVCSGCGKSYIIGHDAAIVIIESAYNLTNKSIIMREESIRQKEDIVSTLLDVTPDNIAQARANACASGRAILDVRNEYQSRVWRCQACNKVNAYRVNGKTRFYKKRLSTFLKHTHLENAWRVYKCSGQLYENIVASIRLSTEILCDIVIKRLDQQKQKNDDCESLCVYRRACESQDIGFLSVRDRFRDSVIMEWTTRFEQIGDKKLTRLYNDKQINDLLDNSLCAIAGIVPDYFILDDWNSEGSFRIAPVIPEVDYGKIDWQEILGDPSGFGARAKMILSHIRILSEQEKVEVFLNYHPLKEFEDYLYVACQICADNAV